MNSWQEVGSFLYNLIAIYFAALIIVRLMGKRALGELSLFDLVIMVGIGEVIVIVGLEQKVPFIKGLIILFILGGMERLFSILTFRSNFFSKLIEGKPTLLIKDGEPLTENLAREHISWSDLRQELRKQGVARISQVSEAILEACGKVSVITKDEADGAIEEQLLSEIKQLRQELTKIKAKLNLEKE